MKCPICKWEMVEREDAGVLSTVQFLKCSNKDCGYETHIKLGAKPKECKKKRGK